MVADRVRGCWVRVFAMGRPTLLLVASTSLVVVASQAQQTVYFLATQWPELPPDEQQNLSFVVGLSRAEDIEKAREFVAKPTIELGRPVDSMIGAFVTAGADGINRNYLNPDLPAWSWRITEFQGFYGIGTDDVFVTPDGLEFLYGGLPPDSRTEFWLIALYSITRELGPLPFFVSAAQREGGLEFRWVDPRTNCVYTLETKPLDSTSSWEPVPGAAWPLQTNQWTVPTPLEGSRLYRVTSQTLPAAATKDLTVTRREQTSERGTAPVHPPAPRLVPAHPAHPDSSHEP